MSTLNYALFLITQLSFLHLTYMNHYTSRRSSDLILLFWPIYVLVAAVRIRTMILTGNLAPHLNKYSSGRVVLAREALWLASIGVGLHAFVLELFSPEKQWRKIRWPAWRSEGKVRLEDSDEEDEADDTVQPINGGGAVSGKTEDGDVESPVVTANLYERLTFSWLTRMSLSNLTR